MTELAVLVPVLNRPQNVAPLVESFLTSDTPDTLWFIIDEADTEEHAAYLRLNFDSFRHDAVGRIQVSRNMPTSWPVKINCGIREAGWEHPDWFLLAADDIRFTPGWWEATAELRADPQIGVIGTNDSLTGTGNPAVAEGTHTCHPLIRASYIREQGTWDGPGRAVCDEYHHWYVDNELVITAKQRHAWAYCRDAVLEHLHPYWKGTDQISWDDTYTLGEAHAEEDKQTWFRRAALNGPL